jgi:cysteine desulfurase / selenocysteine lyase
MNAKRKPSWPELDRAMRETSAQGFSRRGFLGTLAGGAAALTVGPFSSAATLEAVLPPPESLDGGANPEDDRYWDLVASQFMLRKGLSYMNTGTRGPSPRSVFMAQVGALEALNSDYFGYGQETYTADYQKSVREKLARFVGATEDEIAFSLNTTDGMITGTFGAKLEPGDEIVFTNHDHVGGAHPALQRAAKDDLTVKVIDLSDMRFHPPKSPDVILKAFEATITPRTKLLSFCHINYSDGCVLPVKAICAMARSKGILTIIDGAQPPGMMKLDLHSIGCDMYAGPCHKWVMAGMQTGFFFVREDVRDRVVPVLSTMATENRTMYGAVPPDSRYQPLYHEAAAYEMHGSHDFAARVSIDAALDFHNRITSEAIEARDRHMAQKVHRRLRSIPGVEVFTSDDPALGCALVAFKVKGVATKELNELLWKNHDIYIRNVTHPEVDWDVNRVSLHVMVASAQVDKFLGAVEEIAKQHA